MNVTSQYVQELITKVIDPIERAGFQCYLVGGCVRDHLMGVTQHDYDLCTDALPIDLHGIFSEFSEKSSEDRGVTMPVIELLGKREIVEIATFRKDGATIDGRHTYVEFGGISIDEDAERRDLTINALYADKFGNIIDPTGFGVSDIENKLIRFVGNAEDRISEDYLRAFRFCRFISKLGFTPVDYTWKLDKDSFKNVSKDRQGDEFTKLLMGSSPALGVEYMFKHGIFDAMEWPLPTEKVLISMRLLNQWIDHDWIDMLAVFMHEYDAGTIKKLLTDIRIPNKVQDMVIWLVSNHKRASELYTMTDKFEIWKLVSDSRFHRLKLVSVSIDGEGVLDRSFNPIVHDVEGKPMPERLVTGDVLLSKGFKHSNDFDFRKVIELSYRNQINMDLNSVDEVLNSVL